SPWPVIFRDRRLGEEGYRVWRLAPFYGWSDREGIRSSFVLWPLYRTTDQEDGDFHFHRRDGLLVVWRPQREGDPGTGHSRALDTLLGVLRSDAVNGRSAGQVPALMDSLVPANRGILAMWAPLWGVFRWDTSPGGHLDWSLLWGLASRERGHLRSPWFIDRAPPTEDDDGGGSRTPAHRRHGTDRRGPARNAPEHGRGRHAARGRVPPHPLPTDRPRTHRRTAGPGRHRHGAHRCHPVALRWHGARGAVGRSAAQREPERARADRRARHDEGDGARDDGLPPGRPHRLVDRRRARIDVRL